MPLHRRALELVLLGRGGVVGGNRDITVGKGTAILLVRVGAERKHVILAQGDGGRTGRKLRLEHAGRVDMGKRARGGKGGGGLSDAGRGGEHQVPVGAVRKLVAQGVGDARVHGPVRLLLALMAHVHGPKVEAVAIGAQGMRSGNAGREARAGGGVKVGADGGGGHRRPIVHGREGVMRDHGRPGGREGEVLLEGAGRGEDGVVVDAEGVQREGHCAVIGRLGQGLALV